MSGDSSGLSTEKAASAAASASPRPVLGEAPALAAAGPDFAADFPADLAADLAEDLAGFFVIWKPLNCNIRNGGAAFSRSARLDYGLSRAARRQHIH